MKKLFIFTVSLVLVFCIICSPTFSVYARAEKANDNLYDEIQADTIESQVSYDQLQEIIGILRLDDGSQHQIIGTAVYGVQRSNHTENAVTYTFTIPKSLTRGGSSTIYEPDDGYSSTVYLTINYTTRNDGAEYLLTSVSGYWDIHDWRVSVESAFLSYGCTSYASLITQSIRDVAVGNDFDITTNFSQYIPEQYGVMGANLTVNYLMGTSRRWSFTLTNNLFNNSGFELRGGV